MRVHVADTSMIAKVVKTVKYWMYLEDRAMMIIPWWTECGMREKGELQGFGVNNWSCHCWDEEGWSAAP